MVYGCVGGLIAALKLIQKVILAASLAILGPSLAFGGQILVNTFGGLNTQDNPAAIQPYQSQDNLNVQLQPGMKAVYKRDGYGLFQALPQFSTSAVHGGYHFQQASGSDVQLWGSDINLYGSIGDAAFVKLSTGSVAATWQCTDNLGFAYCLTSNNDTAVKTDGSAANTSFQTSVPLGTMVASTPLQLVVAGVVANPSTLYFSANNNFTNFTTGPLATDPYTEIINAPGSRITHIAYYFGKVFWWKDQSFGYVSGSANQNTVGITIVSNQIGTLDNSSAYWNPTNYEGGQTQNNFGVGTQVISSGNPYFNETSSLGGIFFRGQDNHIYQYDGYTLTRLTRIITPTITTANRRKANSWTQTSQADFQGGLISTSPVSYVSSNTLSTTISPGDVIVSSFISADSPPGQVSNASSSNIKFLSNSIMLSTGNGNIANNGFETGNISNWTTTPGTSNQATTTSGTNCTITPRTGTKMLQDANFGSGVTNNINIIDCLTGIYYSTTSFVESDNSCTWTQRTIASAGSVGHSVKFVEGNNGTINSFSDCFVQSGTDMIFYTASDQTRIAFPQLSSVFFDDVTDGSDTITTGYYTSKAFDTGFTSSTVQIQANWTVNNSTPSFSLLTSKGASGPWASVLSSTGTNAIVNEFLVYSTTISFSFGQSALTSISAVTLLDRSTGTYYSAVNNAPNLTSWGTLNVNDVTPGISTITYFVRSSTGSFAVSASTPAWAIQSKNAQVNYSTYTFMQMRADFFLSAATETPTLNDFTFNWLEGSASDKSYITYFQDAIWISESSGTVTTDDVVYYLDLLNNAWLQFSIPANGFAVENNNLYFGSPSSAKIFKFGGVTTDNGLPINSYWKSKDFTGDDPTRQNEFQQADFIYSEGLSTNTYTYTLDQTTSTAVLIPLFDATATILRRGFLLPVGKLGFYYNFKVGDNSSNAKWSLLMHKATYNSLNWIPKTK